MTGVVLPTRFYSINYPAFVRENYHLVNKFLNYFAIGIRLLHTTRATWRTNSRAQRMNELQSRERNSIGIMANTGVPSRWKFAIRFHLLQALFAAVTLGAATYEPARLTPPKPQREFRGAWVATVENIDWPSKRDLSTAEQKAELLAILDRAAQLNLNTIVFQVRPACDALYASSKEPWSEYLTGTMGKAPAPFYDPLTFAVTEAHRRGLELHAWFNPYRARHEKAKSPIAASHVSRTHPELVRQYGKYLWLDPGERATQDYSLGVVMDVVRRYDVDGIHFDDYFYPYRSYGGKGPDGGPVDFPDQSSWKKFGARSGLSRGDWRRQNVNEFIHRVYRTIKSTKSWVKFGVSPFGIWRPGNPPQIKGSDMYDELYCDPKSWLAHGWVDYLAPQLYWRIDPPQQSFPVLLKWWTEQNSKGRQLLAGLNTAAATTTPWSPGEIPRQIEITRKQKGVSGHLHWNMKNLNENRALADNLVRALYAEPALVPTMPWLDSTAPGKPTLEAGGKSAAGMKVSWRNSGNEKIWLWLLQTRKDGKWTNQLISGEKQSVVLSGQPPDVIALSAVDRTGNLGAPASVKRQSR